MAKSEVLIALAITLFAGLAFADDVVVLTPENFDEEVGQDRYALVEFFTPWFISLDMIFNYFLQISFQ